MRTNSYGPFTVISAARPGLDNRLRTTALEQDLSNNGYTYRRATGCYKGELEPSFVVLGDVGDLTDLAEKYNQECVLVRDCWNDCYYVSKNSKGNKRREHIGSLKSVTLDYLKNTDGTMKDHTRVHPEGVDNNPIYFVVE